MRPLLYLLACLLAACSPSAPISPPKIALILKSLTTETTATLVQNAIVHQAAHPTDYTLTIKGIDNTTDLATQVQHIDQLATTGIQALIISPADPKALIPALKRAADKGILIVHIDTPLDPDTLAHIGLDSPYIGPDHRTAAKQVGLTLAKKLQPRDSVAIITGPTTDPNHQQRLTGLQDAISQTQMQIVSLQTANDHIEQAHALTHALLHQHPTLKAILCTSDTMAFGTLSAIQATGTQRQILVTGYGHIPAIRHHIAEGRLTATADPHTDQLATTAIETTLNILKGKAPPTSQTTPVDLIPP